MICKLPSTYLFTECPVARPFSANGDHIISRTAGEHRDKSRQSFRTVPQTSNLSSALLSHSIFPFLPDDRHKTDPVSDLFLEVARKAERNNGRPGPTLHCARALGRCVGTSVVHCAAISFCGPPDKFFFGLRNHLLSTSSSLEHHLKPYPARQWTACLILLGRTVRPDWIKLVSLSM